MYITPAAYNQECRRAFKKLITGNILSKEQIEVLSYISKDSLLKIIRLVCSGDVALGSNIDALMNLISSGVASLNGSVISTKEEIDWRDVECHLNRLFIDLFSGRDIKPSDALAFKNATRYQIIRGARSYICLLEGENRINFLKNISLLEMLSLKYSVEVEDEIIRPSMLDYEGGKML